MKQILVPFDFSIDSEKALDFAYGFAQNSGAKINLLHVVEHNVQLNTRSQALLNYEQQFRDELVKSHTQHFEALKISEKHKDVDIAYEVKIGVPLHSIIDSITEYEADLIIMGTKGTSGIKEFLIGSNTEKVVRLAHCPVITVPGHSNTTSIQNIVFAINFEDELGPIFNELQKVQAHFEAKVHLLWVDTLQVMASDTPILERLRMAAVDHQLANFEVHTVQAASPEKGILHFANDHQMDMIAMATHGFKGLAHLLLGSVAENVVNHTQIPVWTFGLNNGTN